MPHRPEKISTIIRATVALHAQQIPPNIASIVSVVDVRVSEDLSYADVTLSALTNVDDALTFLQRRASTIRAALARELRLFRIPQLRFQRDADGERAQRVEDILKKIATTSEPKKTPRRTRGKTTSS